MPLDPAAKRFLDRLASLSPSARTLTVAERRDALEHLLGFAGGERRTCEVEDLTVPGPTSSLRIRLYSPPPTSDAPLPALVFFHGGGLIAGSLDTHDGISRHLACASGCRVISVDYRLAPEHPFPAAIEDGCAASAWIFKHVSDLRIDPDRLAIGGDSAGGTLAAVVCQRLVGDAYVRPAMQFLLCPIMDFCAQTQSRRELSEGYFLDRATLEHDLRHYLEPGTDPSGPLISPLRAPDVSRFPPACIHTAEFDPLRDEGRAYADRLEDAGVETLYRCHSGMIHLFYGMSALIPYASMAFELMGRDIRSMLGRRAGGIRQTGGKP